MTERRLVKRRRLAYELLGLILISAALAAIAFILLSHVAVAVVEIYCFEQDIVMSEFDWLHVDQWIFSLSAFISVAFFSALVLVLIGERMAYIRTLTRGIDALRLGQADCVIPLEGKNELTELADAINYMSATQRQLREKEQRLAWEKDQLIRTLSHDIRTPLTSILAYSEYLASHTELPAQAQKTHLLMIQKKAEQIRELTDLLLDGGKRQPEPFENAHLLMEQLAAEFEEELEDRFPVETDLSGCPSFAGAFDVQELRRIFDNLASNVHKYADPGHPVRLRISKAAAGLVIHQENRVRPEASREGGHQLGINSIRRIAQHYSGHVSVRQAEDTFAITVTLEA